MSLGAQSTSPYYPFWPYYGYFDLGPVQLPPLPQIVGLTDRTTAAVQYLGFDGSRLVLYTTISAGAMFRAKVYGPYDGPYIQGLGLRLGLNNGRLVFDTDPDPKNTGPGPFGFNPNSWLTVALVGATMVSTFGFPSNPNVYDHLQFTVVNTQ